MFMVKKCQIVTKSILNFQVRKRAINFLKKFIIKTLFIKIF